MWNKLVDINTLNGKTFTKVWENGEGGIGFENNEECYSLHHEQNCCENVYLEDISGDLSDLVGVPLTVEQVDFDRGKQNEYDECYTWTFYKFRTIKGYVDVRFYGTSNGYYSESVDLYKVK